MFIVNLKISSVMVIQDNNLSISPIRIWFINVTSCSKRNSLARQEVEIEFKYAMLKMMM